MVSKNKTGQTVLNFVFVLLCVAAVAPFLLLVSSSLTEEATLMRDGYSFFPKVFSGQSYVYLMKSAEKIVRD